MKAAEKNIQRLSSSESRSPNAKYKAKKWKVDLTSIEDYIQYMEDRED